MTEMIDFDDQATVSDVIIMLQEIEEQGKGGYVVYCNGEYVLARKGEQPDVVDTQKLVDMGGYR